MRLSINQLSHREYLKSSTWQKIRTAALDHYGKICGKCGEFGTDVHHMRYPEIQGEEKMSDLIVVCRSCHDAIHAAKRSDSFGDGIHVQALFNYLTVKQKEVISKKVNLNNLSYFTFISDTPKGQEVRSMALDILDLYECYGIEIKKKETENYLTPKESRKLQEMTRDKERRKQLKKQNAWKKLLIESNPRLHGKIN